MTSEARTRAKRINGPLVVRFEAKVDRSGGADACHLWTAHRNPTGYGMVKVGTRMSLSHRVAYEIAHGPIPDGMCVCHRCDTPACVNPDHLWLGTKGANNADRDAKGRNIVYYGDDHWSRKQPERLCRGAEHPGAKLTAERVTEARARRAAGESIASIARDMGTGWTAMKYAIAGRSWAHVA